MTVEFLERLDKEKMKEMENDLVTLITALNSLEECYDYISWKKLSTFIEAKEKIWHVANKMFEQRESAKNEM